MSKQLRLDVAQLTDVGRKRPHNEDNMAYVIPKDPMVMARKGALFIVADGMGGHAAGEVASEIAVDTVSNAYYQDDSEDIAISLLHAIKRANTLIHQRSAENVLRSGMGTTCVAAVLRSNIAYVANVGDSRAYVVRHGHVRQVSQDHSWVAEQVRAGLLTEEQARSHAQRNVITRCLGTQADVDIDIFPEPLEEGDTLVLCTDGLSGLISDEDLCAIVDQYVPQESVYHLVERANENGGSDNITAIVVRIQEVGWEQPNGSRTIRLSGRDNGGETATLVMSGSPAITMPTNMSPLLEEGRIPSAPLRLASGPLPGSETITAPQPALSRPRRKAGRLLYPTLALFVLLIVALVGGGAFYWLHLSGSNVDASLTSASNDVKQAKNEVTGNNPVAALSDLSRAQGLLRTIQTSAMTDAQSNTLLSVQKDFTSTVQAAIRAYNQQYHITALPCSNAPTPSDTISTGSTATVPESVAVMLGTGGAETSYVLAQDHHLYQLSNTHSLVNRVAALDAFNVLKIASDNTRLLALTSSAGTGGNSMYSLNMLTLDAKGALTNNSANIDTTLTQQQNLQPSLLTAWGADIYVVLTSPTSPNTVVILNYNADKLTDNPVKMSYSVTSNIVSVAAFPNHQLFLSLNGGMILSLVFSTSQTPQAAPSSVVVKDVIAPPLTVSATDFKASTAVPAPTPVAQTQSATLQLSQTPFLTAASFANTLHLYIVDGNRVIDLVTSSTAGTTAVVTSAPGNQTATPAITPNTAATAIAAVTATANATANLAHMTFNGQFTSPALFTGLKGIVADQNSNTPFLYLLNQSAQSASVRTLITLDLNQKGICGN